jgi:xylulokinase
MTVAETRDTGREVVIGIDLGTSSLKAVAVDRNGHVLARANSTYRTSRPEEGAAEQSPSDWIAAFHAVTTAIGISVEPSRWAAIGLSGMLPTLVCLDEDRTVIGPAITWEDGRAEAEGAKLIQNVGADVLYSLTGQRVDGRYLLPMFSRLRNSRNPLLDEVSTIAGAKDYLFWFLTGELLTDPSTAAGYGAYDLNRREWDSAVLELASSPKLPDVVLSSDHRPMLPALAAVIGCIPGLPIVLGAADSVLGAYGLGATSPGDVAYIAGTSTVILGHSDELLLDLHKRYLVTPTAGDGFGMEMDLLATGAAHDWLVNLFDMPGGAAEIATLAATVSASAHPLFLPYLTPGEQGALWDPRLTGTLHGVTLRTGRAEIARALVSGIIIESRRAIGVLSDAFGSRQSGDIMISGSSASTPAFQQDLADATQRNVLSQPQTTDHSAIGAAYLSARAALGWQISTSRPANVTRPDLSRGSFWDDLAQEHDALRQSLQRGGPGE